VTKPDATTAIDFYLDATFQARDFVHLILNVVTAYPPGGKQVSRRRKLGNDDHEETVKPSRLIEAQTFERGLVEDKLWARRDA